MRQIKFRGKRVDGGEWVYGFYTQWFFGETKRHAIIEGDSTACVILIDENTLCQFTGLHDKNGKEIWEGGDVVRCIGGTLPAEVVWHNGAWCLETHNPDTKQNPLEMYYFTEAEVIGNIHDNPELVK